LCEDCAVLLNIPQKELHSSDSLSVPSDCSCKKSKKRLCPSCTEKKLNPTIKTRNEIDYPPLPQSEDITSSEETNTSGLIEHLGSSKAVIPAVEFFPKVDVKILTNKSKTEIIEGALSRSTIPTHLHKKAEEHLTTQSWVVKIPKLPLTTASTALKKLPSSNQGITNLTRNCDKIVQKPSKPECLLKAGVKYRSIGVNTDEAVDLAQRNILLEKQIAELKLQLEGQISVPEKRYNHVFLKIISM
jgi:NAD-dependent SIR2 family protein deacetylase